MRETPRSFTDLSDLTYAIGSREFDELLVKTVGEAESPLEILWVAFAGEADDRGRHDHASFMAGVIGWALSSWPACGIVIDLRQVKYTWGDRMQNVLRVPYAGDREAEQVVQRLFAPHLPQKFPTAVLVSELCGDAIRTLVRDEMAGYPGVIVEEEPSAVEHIYRAWTGRPA
jgi:hypothetical protein